jgi:hypothetical protein
MHMKLAKGFLVGLLGLALQGTAIAQIYESTDAEGVQEFSDTPSAGSEVVDLQKTNVADEPPDIPEAPRAEAARPAPAASAAPAVVGEPETEIYDGYHNNNAEEQRRLDKDRPPGNTRPGVRPLPAVVKPGVHKPPGAGGHGGGRH